MLQNDKMENKEVKSVPTEQEYSAPQLVTVGTAVELIQGLKCCHDFDSNSGWYWIGQIN